MNFNGLFNEAANRIKPDTVVRIARDARPNSDYFFNSILPERTVSTREISTETMTFRSIMAGLVPMDGPYPEGMVVEGSGFSEKLVKIAIQQSFNEGALVQLQEIMKNVLLSKGASAGIKVMCQNFLNFVDKMLMQPHLDATEYLRAQALLNGELDWTFGKMKLSVDYGIPAAAYATNRTGNDAYDGSTSKFWTDILAAKTYLKNRVQTFVAHGETINSIISNSNNSLRIVSEFEDGFEVVKYSGALEKDSSDSRFRCRLVSYNLEYEVLDTSDPKKAQTVTKPFLPVGDILAVGKPDSRQGFFLTDNVDQGSTEDPGQYDPLGYTAIGPVTENDGKPGRWARVYTPEDKPASLIGQAVATVLPVILNPRGIYRLRTTVS